MSVKLQKEHIRLSEVVCSRYCQTTVENDLIVPDIKPDILKILQVSNTAVITQQNIQTDKVYVQGIIHLNILYLPDTLDSGKVKSISTSVDFSHEIDMKGAKPGMDLWVDLECEPAEYTLVNSRKLNLKSKVGFSTRLSKSSEFDIATDILGDEPIEKKVADLKIYNPAVDACRDILLREKLEVPAGKPSICEVLRLSVKPSSIELRLLSDKAIAKGELKICTLYCGEDESGSLQFMEHTVPFNELLEIDGLSENMTGEIDYCVKDTYFEVCPDPDGDKRILGCEFTISASVRALSAIECCAVEDAYGLKHELDIQKSSYNIEQLIESMTAEATVKEQISIPDYLPQLQQLCDLTAVPTIESISSSDGTATVSGYINCNILYLTCDDNTPISGFNHVVAFSHTFNIPDISEDSLCDAMAEIEHISCTISGAKDIELRGIISINLKAINPRSVHLISDISCKEDCPLPKCASMVIYFVQKGDTLWKIAKRFHTTPDEIMRINNLESDLIVPNQQLFIFR